MDEDVRTTEYGGAGESSGGGEDDRVSEWELGLPNSDDLLPLSHQLISPELASAFSISPELYRTISDVDRASKTTIERLRSSELPKMGPIEDDDGDEDGDGDDVAKAMKRPRLVWTPQLHKRFVDVVSHLGLKNAVPKTIMNMMNVEGLTRENVASHLQKYRLYLKRMEGGREDSESGGGERGGGGGHAGMPVMMHMPMVPSHHGGGYPWMQSAGSYHHRHHSGGNDN